MKLKLDDNGNAVLQDGHPVYIHDDGKEAPFDAPSAVATIKARNAEAKQHRERAEAAEGALKAFEGLDAAAARKAVETLSKLDQSKLVDAGKVDQVLAEANKAWETKLAEAQKRAQELEGQLIGEVVGGAFARSKYLAEKTVLPPDLAQAAFGKHFKVEGGKLQAFDAEGNPIFSRAKPGNAAEFDEAIEILVDAYPRKDSILRAPQGGGSGTPGNGGGGSGSKTLTRAAFDAKEPADKAKFIAEGGKVVDQAA